jgi:dihydrofolate reductase
MRLIVACTPCGGIGINNKLPWDNLDGDLIRFKRLTSGGIIIMGKNTWKSLPIVPLPDRINIVITKTRIHDRTVLVNQTTDIFDHFPEAWIIGGAQLINSSWDKITEVHLSRTFAEYHCDTFIDLVQLSKFSNTYTEHCSDHTYEIWKKT